MNEMLEERVAERTAQLQAANKELEAFAYSVSHDLRAPLRAISAYSNFLVEDYGVSLDAEGLRLCTVIQGEARRMGSLIDDLLTFSRLGRNELQASEINMDSMVDAVYMELTTPENRERIDFHVDPLPKVNCDSTLMKQVWINLLSNAIKFSAKRTQGVIHVTSSKVGEEIIFSIRDNGAGFDMRYADKLFGVFQRLHSDQEFPGTGVGLAIVQRIVHRHGGRVWAEGQNDQGATFHFALPQHGDKS